MARAPASASRPFAQRWRRSMTPRRPDEPHRTATPLELFFDLVFVVAIAQAASGLHHAVAAGHPAEGVVGFAMAFFGIWWAWMNFTWFASAYDCDDGPYRLLVFAQLTGALIFAAGVDALSRGDLRVGVVGYVVMRFAMVIQWLRAGSGDPERRATAHRFALGIAVVQVAWVSMLLVPASAIVPGFFALAVAELLIPAWAESASPTPWHPHHVAERYGLLTIIVLGESVLAATTAIQSALTGGEALRALLPHIGGGLLILYAMWWIYFDRPVHDLLLSMRRAFIWGYAHFFVFASAAAVGAGLAVSTDVVTHHARIGKLAAGWAVAIPVAIYVATLWILHDRPHGDGAGARWPGIAALALVLVAPFTPAPELAIGLVLTGLLATKLRSRDLIARRGEPAR